MPDANARRDIREDDSLGADGLQGFPKETGTERSGVEDRGFKSHPRRLNLQYSALCQLNPKPPIQLILSAIIEPSRLSLSQESAQQ
jgi:hypothetical protein